jgi:hypothetical protein
MKHEKEEETKAHERQEEKKQSIELSLRKPGYWIY